MAVGTSGVATKPAWQETAVVESDTSFAFGPLETLVIEMLPQYQNSNQFQLQPYISNRTKAEIPKSILVGSIYTLVVRMSRLIGPDYTSVAIGSWT